MFAVLALSCALLCATEARAEGSGGIIDRVGNVFDDAARMLDYVGAKAGDIIGPGLGLGQNGNGGFTETRQSEEAFPVTLGSTVSLSNEFGEIRVSTWDSVVVQVTTTVSVTAENADLAREISSGIQVKVEQTPNQLAARTTRPDTRAEASKPTISVNLNVTVPRNCNLILRNDFGDTYVSGVGGTVSADVSYGLVELRDIGGPVNVRSRGEFAVRADMLYQGGTFELSGASSEFSRVSGPLKIGSFRGAVTLRDLPPETNIDAVSELGPVYLYLPEGATPDLVATAISGTVEAGIPLSMSQQGEVMVARSSNLDSKQRISLRSSFANISVQRQGIEAPTPPTAPQEGQPFKEVVTHEAVALDPVTLRVETIPGNIKLTGTDDTKVTVTATKLVRVNSQDNVRPALQAMEVQLLPADAGIISLRTSALDVLSTLGCTSHRVDLEIKCPRAASIEITTQDGQTFVSEMGGKIVVKQTAGAISVEHVKGEVDLTNAKGDITVASCAGPVTAAGSFGTIRLTDIFGKIAITGNQAEAIIESPHAELQARTTGGNIRIISFEAIHGNYDVNVEQGNISILLPPDSDASLSVTADNGVVQSSMPLTGNIKKDYQEFIKINSGPHRVTLQTKNGNIIID